MLDIIVSPDCSRVLSKVGSRSRCPKRNLTWQWSKSQGYFQALYGLIATSMAQERRMAYLNSITDRNFRRNFLVFLLWFLHCPCWWWFLSSTTMSYLFVSTTNRRSADDLRLRYGRDVPTVCLGISNDDTLGRGFWDIYQRNHHPFRQNFQRLQRTPRKRMNWLLWMIPSIICSTSC